MTFQLFHPPLLQPSFLVSFKFRKTILSRNWVFMEEWKNFKSEIDMHTFTNRLRTTDVDSRFQIADWDPAVNWIVWVKVQGKRDETSEWLNDWLSESTYATATAINLRTHNSELLNCQHNYSWCVSQFSILNSLSSKSS